MMVSIYIHIIDKQDINYLVILIKLDACMFLNVIIVYKYFCYNKMQFNMKVEY